jgi:hypothetical protein
MAELFDLHTARGIALLVCCIAMAILSIIHSESCPCKKGGDDE